MLFNSANFIFFLLAFFSIYIFSTSNLRKYVLLIASIVFYAQHSVKLLAVLCAMCFLVYVGAILINKINNLKSKMYIAFCTGALVIFNLVYFKYIGFFSEILNELFAIVNTEWQIRAIEVALPLGISFFTFQLLAYLLDVYKERVKSEKNIIIFFLFILFFPQLIAGPIERASKLIPQLKELKNLRYSLCVSGFLLMTWGYFQKVVLADNLANFVGKVFSRTDIFSGLGCTLAAVSFSLQIFFDFSGYVDISRGISKILNIDLSKNFNYPYLSQSVTEFWSRWHITLTQWLRDYIFFPMTFNQKIKMSIWVYIIIVFIFSGLWHGSSMTFIIWGVLHGLYVSIEQSPSIVLIREKINPYLRIVVTFLLVSFTWVFFRAESVADALLFFKSMYKSWTPTQHEINVFSKYTYQVPYLKAVISLILGLIISFGGLKLSKLIPKNDVAKLLLSVFLIYLILIFGEFHERKFIYFQF